MARRVVGAIGIFTIDDAISVVVFTIRAIEFLVRLWLSRGMLW